ncbi:thiamine pyrophosphate-binding protein [Uliginosibacterium sp. sgz301328]|uniref:thiamine pyrophosphate-binding protein n=1 Tax=Uliginosibacterium sp. sgz301328 TaxID=3243764 RepID=UPI00359D8F27
MKYSELLGEWLVELGYTHCFFVAGGGIMHLLDGVRNRFECIPVVHEVSAGISAEHFNQCAQNGQRAFALVTTGPGLTNVVTAVAGCYVEHRELLVIAGQVKSTDLLTHPERQRGVQEVDGSAICAPVSVRSECLRAPISRSRFLSLARLAQGPHPGPVVIEVCLDVQGAAVDRDTLCKESGPTTRLEIAPREDDIASMRKLLNGARRPLMLFGGLLTREAAWNALPVFERMGLPIATTTSAIDRVPTASPVFAGRPGTWGGQRAANLILAQADVVIVLGAQLDLQQTGFNYREYAPQARLVHVFPSQAELDRVGPPSHSKVLASPDAALAALLPGIHWEDKDGWSDYVQEVRAQIPVLEPANTSAPGYVNSFRFLGNLSRATQPSDVLALCSSGGTFTGALQSYEVASGQLATTSAAHASMGYGLATAIGAAFADRSRRVVLTEGEGGFAQNLQELAVIKRFSLPIKIFLLENQGYASIRATQKKFFNGAYLGCDPETGLGFPNWEKLFEAYDIPCRVLRENDAEEGALRKLLDDRSGPEAWVVRVDPNQPNWPAVSTVLAADGSLTSSPLYDMLPGLPDDMLARVGRYLPGR